MSKNTGDQNFEGQPPRTQDSPSPQAPDSPLVVTRQPDQGHQATVEVIPSDADRFHLNRSGHE